MSSDCVCDIFSGKMDGNLFEVYLSSDVCLMGAMKWQLPLKISLSQWPIRGQYLCHSDEVCSTQVLSGVTPDRESTSVSHDGPHDLINGLWLVESDHMTWMLTSDWPRQWENQVLREKILHCLLMRKLLLTHLNLILADSWETDWILLMNEGGGLKLL